MANEHLLALWLVMTVLYLAVGFAMLAINFRRETGKRKRSVRDLLISIVIFAVIVVHNVFVRNWSSWFGTPIPPLFSTSTFVVEGLVFLIVPLTLTRAVLAKQEEGPAPIEPPTR